jgi:murein DD-endopeptidase MepM/ murein hydrolase activator NlpD
MKMSMPVNNAQITGAYNTVNNIWPSGHTGIDLISTSGDLNIYSACNATVIDVISASVGSSYGHYIKAQAFDDPSITIIYAHLVSNSARVRVGDTISAGQIIGRMGATGNVTGVHLHFEVRKNNKKVSPCPYLNISNKVGVVNTSQTWKVMVNSLFVRESGNASANTTGVVYKDQLLTVDEKVGYWCHHTDGWSCEFDKNGDRTLQLISDNASTSVTQDTTTPINTVQEIPDSGRDITVYTETAGAQEYLNSLNNRLRIKNLRGIHGMPYQYMPLADRRLDDNIDGFGRVYAEKIVSKMPLLLMTPGRPTFLASFSEKEKKNLLESFVDIAAGKETQGALSDIIKREGKYYSLTFDYNGYYSYLNPFCRSGARFLGIHNELLDGTKLEDYRWNEYTNDSIQSFLPYKGCIPFYIDSDTQITDSFGNSTTESGLANKVNSVSDMGRELNFILGKGSSMTGLNLDKFTSQEDLASNMQNMNDMINNTLNGRGQIFTNIANSLQTIVSGGKLIFPQIWSDSDFSRSYDIKLKLITPDSDKLSWYLNIYVPLAHLLNLVIPRQADVNGFISPYLIRASYKGMFNCDMGIITNLSATKGEEGEWTKDGLPTVVDVSFTIKDLYSAISITSNTYIGDENFGSKQDYNLMNNTILMDYIANLCGININEPDIIRTIQMYFVQNVKNRVTDSVTLGVFGAIDQWCSNAVMRAMGLQ